MKKILLISLLIMPFLASAQISISTSSTVTQNFNGIGATATANLPTNWKVDKNDSNVRTVGSFSAAVSATERVDGENISTTAGNGIYNAGIAPEGTSSDRAIGFLSSGTASKSGNLYVHLINSSATPIQSFSISYDVEKYRNGSNSAGFTIQLFYSTNGTSWVSAGSAFTTNFVADADNTGTATPPISSTNVSSSFNVATPLNQTGNMYFAWNYSVTSGTTTTSAQLLAIDNISITANSTLPISLTSFTAKAVEKTILLNWATASEKGNKSFEVLKSYDGKTFTSIASLSGAGNSDSEKTYSFIDENPYAGANYYQLKQVDFDGKSAVSEVISATAKIEEVKLSAYASISDVSVNINSPNQTTATLSLFDMSGRKLATQSIALNKGFNTVTFFQALNNGTYFISLIADGKATSLKFVK